MKNAEKRCIKRLSSSILNLKCIQAWCAKKLLKNKDKLNENKKINGFEDGTETVDSNLIDLDGLARYRVC